MNKYLLIGDGRLAKHLAHYFELLQIPYNKWNRQDTPLELENAFTASGEGPILLAISDEAIQPFYESHLREHLQSQSQSQSQFQSQKRVFVHFSGALEIAGIVSIHPLMTFSHHLYSLETYTQIPFIISDPQNKNILSKLPNPRAVIAPEQKPLYHALCVMAGNFTTILWQKTIQDFKNKLGLDSEILIPYLEQTVANITDTTTDSILTGPLARKEWSTIESNIKALEAEKDPFSKIYKSFVNLLPKQQQQQQTIPKISMVTCYDYLSAKIIAQTSIDWILVGDSVAMVVHGHPNTLTATVEMMCTHVAAVAKGASNKMIIGDLPFLSYRKSLRETTDCAGRLLASGAVAVKLEGACGNMRTIKYLIGSGIPVMGHLGLTPQHINLFGGFKIQGKSKSDQERIKKEALQLQEAGVFAIVLECIPHQLAAEISDLLTIPTIGIGAGPHCDGQVLVWHDLLGMDPSPKHNPRFVKKYLDGAGQIQKALAAYHLEVKNSQFPTLKESY